MCRHHHYDVLAARVDVPGSAVDIDEEEARSSSRLGPSEGVVTIRQHPRSRGV